MLFADKKTQGRISSKYIVAFTCLHYKIMDMDLCLLQNIPNFRDKILMSMWRLNTWIVLAFSMMVCSCQNQDGKQNEVQLKTNYMNDPHSFSTPEEAVITHLNLDLNVDFAVRKISGVAEIEFESSEDAKQIVLDGKDLHIQEIIHSDGAEASYRVTEEDSILGSSIKIELRENSNSLIIKYATGEGAEALQWLDKAQTADKTHPFLYSQSQAILARSWIPLQDSPGVRFTYDAKVTVPQGMMALMSAENPQSVNEEGVYLFSMPQPIPSYLMSLAVGNIDFAPIGERTGVYAEPGMLKRSVEEFSEMDEMLNIAEKLYGKYQWGRYDLIVLPPSFPFGGMENPRITFATPTILAGDKSLTSLVAHELAHSWSGNLVTNATWNDFWLNEGFTVYFEHRIMEALKGEEYANMLSSLSMRGLVDEVDLFMRTGLKDDTRLKLDLTGRNPDDGLTAIAYDKGYFFLRRLEEAVGRERFDEFLKNYFKEFAFKSNNTEAFAVYLQENLFEKNGIEPIDDLNEWIYGTGLPSSLPVVISKRFALVDQAVEKFLKSDLTFETSEWSSHEWVHFIKNLPEKLSGDQMSQLDKAFDFTHSGNSEILGVWYVHCARAMYQPSFEAMSEFLIQTGRRKFLMPIYEELIKTDQGKSLASSIYKRARVNYHYVASSSLDKLID